MTVRLTKTRIQNWYKQALKQRDQTISMEREVRKYHQASKGGRAQYLLQLLTELDIAESWHTGVLERIEALAQREGVDLD